MDGDVRCARCEQTVDVWGYWRSFAVWFLGGGLVIFIGALTAVIGIGLVIAPVGAVMVFASPVGALATKGVRRCRPCKQTWRAKKDPERALPHPP